MHFLTNRGLTNGAANSVIAVKADAQTVGEPLVKRTFYLCLQIPNISKFWHGVRNGESAGVEEYDYRSSQPICALVNMIRTGSLETRRSAR